MKTEELSKVLAEHNRWLNNGGGSRADLRGANLSDADLSGADLRSADLRGANLSGANLCDADLCDADLRGANLRGTDLRRADLSGANLRGTDMRLTDMRGANLSFADMRLTDMRGADLSRADLSGAVGLPSASDYISAHFERVTDGYVAYKTFGGHYAPPQSWSIEAGAIISENVNFDRCQECGSGINVAPLAWVREHYEGQIWKVLIRFEWLAGVCVPYMSDGKIRCEKVELLEVVESGGKINDSIQMSAVRQHIVQRVRISPLPVLQRVRQQAVCAV